MSTFHHIKKMADEIYPGCRHGLPHFICAWAWFNPGNVLGTILQNAGSSVSEMFQAYEPFLKMDSVSEDNDLFEFCILNHDQGQLTGFCLLLGICNTPESRLFRALSETGVNVSKLKTILEKWIKGHTFFHAGIASKGEDMTPIDSLLFNYGRDLNSLALNGQFEGLADRDEMDHIIDVLLRRQKDNIALTGPAGVGKTCLVELLSRKIAHNEIPGFPAYWHIFELSLGKVVAGTKYRGDFEERLYNILNAVEKHGNLILFFDEMHILWGAGSAERTNTDAANLLKPYLSRDRLRVIGATTHEEYEKYIKTDPALERRFQEIKLEKPDEVLTKKIVMKQAKALEKYHGVDISEEMVIRAAELSDRYLSDRNQPDKSIDLLDISSVHAKRRGSRTLTIDDLYQTLSNQIGKRIKPPEENTVTLWINNFRGTVLKKDSDIIVLGDATPKHLRKLIKTYLTKMTLNLFKNQVELIFDEERLIDYLLSELKRDHRKAKGIFQLLDRKILKHIAVALMSRNAIHGPARIILGEDFYNREKVSHVECETLEEGVEAVTIQGKETLQTKHICQIDRINMMSTEK